MGRWFAGALDAGATDRVTVAFADAESDAASEAAAACGGRAVPLDADERFDAVCIAVPIPAATDAIAAHAEQATHAVIDVTGSAEEPVAAMREYALDCERMSLHPLFAPENAPGNVAVVADEPGPVTDAVRDALVAEGNRCFDTTAEEHDRMMETVQARAHAAVLAFGLAAEDVPERFHTPVSAALFDLVEQVGGGDPRVYADIQAAFDGAEDVAAVARELAETDTEAFVELYREVQGEV